MGRLYYTMGNHMASSNAPRNRGPNSCIRFDLAQFTERLFASVGAKGQFTGPGPVQLGWLSADSTRVERFAVNHLAEHLFSKYDDGVKSSKKRDAAIRKFEEGELCCSLTNFKFQPLAGGQPPVWLESEEMLPEGYSAEDSAVFRRARSLISRVLGNFPGWEAVLELSDFGPGATTRLKRRDGDRSNKWADNPHATIVVSSLLPAVFDGLPLVKSRIGKDGSLSQMVLGNKLDWVPKNYKTDRTIAIEPDWNMFLQKGIGSYIRRRLKYVNQNLDDQGVNQFLAAVGSIDGSVATLDLSMASDTVAYRLVEYLIRDDWFAALEQLRSPIGSYKASDDSLHHVVFEKFSSMGNGFTFELESLIFWGICRAVSDLSGETDHRTYVYGDDIVVPTGIAALATMYLEKAGFVVNREKSFLSGPFRESCGGHYLSGDDVTPFYVREAVDTLDRLFLLHNNVFRWFNRHPGICYPEQVKDLLLWIRSHAPREWQQPRLSREDVGDGGFIGSFDEVCPQRAGLSRNRAGWEGWRVETLQYRAKRKSPLGRKTRYRVGSGPDLASLWSLRSIAEWRALRYHQRGAWLGWRKSRDFLERLFPSGMGDRDVPYTERYWYTAVQVLPHEWGSSWFSCLT